MNVYIDINNENNLNLTIIGEVDMKKEYKYTPPENDYDDRDVYGEVRILNNKQTQIRREELITPPLIFRIKINAQI